MAKVMADPRFADMMDPANHPFDGKRMFWGGFQSIVSKPEAEPRMKIDFISDVACPWCAVGLNSLEIALKKIGGDVPVDLHFQPFELNPQMPAEGEDAVQHLSRKYGAPPEQLKKNREHLRERGAAVGFTFGDRPHVWNTFDAHRLLHWAGLRKRSEAAGAEACAARRVSHERREPGREGRAAARCRRGGPRHRARARHPRSRTNTRPTCARSSGAGSSSASIRCRPSSSTTST